MGSNHKSSFLVFWYITHSHKQANKWKQQQSVENNGFGCSKENSSSIPYVMPYLARPVCCMNTLYPHWVFEYSNSLCSCLSWHRVACCSCLFSRPKALLSQSLLIQTSHTQNQLHVCTLEQCRPNCRPTYLLRWVKEQSKPCQYVLSMFHMKPWAVLTMHPRGCTKRIQNS